MLRPRAHALGAERAVWGRAELGGAAACAEPDGDCVADEVLAGGSGCGMDTDYHPAAEPEGSIRAEHASAGEGEKRPAEQSDSNSNAATPEKAPAPAQEKALAQEKEKTKKADFMDMLRGEVRVLLGKIEHKPAKVEQGQRLKAREPEGASAQTT
ncbi:hypothetical protein C2E23DRAFT_885210 [Lenzites betulinus]|nr:hypothetical protein C2E23DRAFT_885210 [Lenzites betulinus]